MLEEGSDESLMEEGFQHKCSSELSQVLWERINSESFSKS